jgi:hypothetical protein
MGMPRKGSRKVEVHGEQYLWRVGGYTRYTNETPVVLTLTCQRDEDSPGRVMQATLKSVKAKDMDNYELEHGMHRATLNPSEVKQIIAHALSKGWDPAERGAAFQLLPRHKQPLPQQYDIVAPI